MPLYAGGREAEAEEEGLAGHLLHFVTVRLSRHVEIRETFIHRYIQSETDRRDRQADTDRHNTSSRRER